MTELQRFLFECGRTYAIIEADDEPASKALALKLIQELGGLSIRLRRLALQKAKEQLNDGTKRSSAKCVHIVSPSLNGTLYSLPM